MNTNWNPSGIPASGDSLIWDGTSNRETKFNVALTVGAIVMMPAWTGPVNFNTAAITISGSMGDFRAGGTFSFTTAKITFTGTAAQTFIPHPTQAMPAIEQNGTGGTTVTTNGLNTASLSLLNLASNGAFNLGSGLTHTISGMTLSTNGNLNFGSSTLDFTGTAADFSSLTTLTVGSGNLKFSAAAGSQVFTPKSGATFPPITHTGAGTLQLATNDLTCLSFSNSAGVLDFNSRNITTVSSGNFTVTNGTTSTFTNLAGRTITVAGNASFTGQNGNLLNLNPASAWTLTATASSTVSADYATIMNGTVNPSNIYGVTTNSTDGGSNTRWAFYNTLTWDGGGGDYNWSTAANWSGNSLPNIFSTIVFDGTSTKKCVLDVDASVLAISFTSAYSSSDANTGKFDFGTKTLTVSSGNADFTMGSGASIVAGTGALALTSTANQTFTPRSGATYPAISKSGAGSVTVSTSALTAGAFTLSGGGWDWGSSALTHAVASIATSGSAAMTFGPNTVQITSGNADFSGLSSLDVSSGALAFTGPSGTQTFTPKSSTTHPAVTHSGAGTLQLATNDLSTPSFSQTGGVLSFNGRDITTTGDFSITNGTTSSISGLAGRTITVGGNANFVGQSGNLLNLNPASGWTLTATASSTVSAAYANIAYGTVNPSGISGMATVSTNGGNNVRWIFVIPVVWDGGGTDGTCGGAAGDGNKWSCAANWGANVVPATTDSVIFNATSTKNCKLDAATTTRSIVFSSGYTGTFDFQTYTLTLTNIADFRTGGAITPGTGKISLTGSSPKTLIPPGQQANSMLPSIEQNGTGGTTVTTNRLRTSALILANLASNGVFNLGSGLTDTVTTTLTLNANGSLNFGSSTLVFEGTTANFSSLTTLTAGTGTLSFNATGGTQTFTPKSGATFPAMVKANAGTVTVATNGLTAGALSVTGGTWNWGSSTLTHAVASIATSGSSTMTFGTNTVQVTSGNADLSALATVNANTGTLEFTASTGTQILTPKSATTHPSISHSGAGSLQLATNDLSTLGFSQSAGVLDFNGRNITTTSSGNFLIANGTSSALVNLGGRTLTVAGTASLNGTASSTLNLNPGSTWTVNATGALSASYANIGNSNAAGSTSAGQATNSENLGSNTNWSFLFNMFSTWAYSTKISFNTTSAGANVSGNVSNFPLLVRLDSNNFFFGQAKPDGSDIRFQDPDGIALSYQIERWDATARKAEIWVKVPQVDGNSDLDYIKMYWGNNSATSMSSGSSVFTTGGGYVAAWHLSQSPGASAPQFTDASGAANNGTAQGGATGDSVTAVSGMGYRLNGSSKYISSTTSYSDQDILTIGTWFRTTTTSGGKLVGWETAQTGVGANYDRMVFMGNDGKLNFGIYNGGNRLITSADSYNDGTWHLVTARVDGSGMALFVDGTLVGSNAQTNPEATTGYWRAGFGGHSGWANVPTSNYFNGSLDEVFFAHASFSVDYIKLLYQTQRPNPTAISYPNTALSTFAYSTKVYVNTTHSGAGVNGDVANFPLLVRLNNGNFNFTQAKPDGGDIRFSDSAGSLLSFEIERFDAANKLAEIWVLLPTVKGYNNAQWFRMHWGKGTATSLSSSSSVFSASNSFNGVWHLNEDGNTTSGGYRDASPYGNNGTGTGLTNSSDVSAAIGLGQTFNGTTSCINVGGGATGSNLHFNSNLTLEGWAYVTTKSASDKILNKSYTNTNTTPYVEYDLAISGTNVGWTSGVTTSGAASWAEGTTSFATSTWYHVASTYDGANIRLYVNGILEHTVAKTGSINDYARNVQIGCYEATSTNHMGGILDEIRIQGAARSADWIRLSYQTQKSGSTVVSVGNRSLDYTHSVRLNFNTTSTGANVSGNVANIPILVRVTSSLLDFSKTQSSGVDLQFVDKSGAYLYHEVVEWDKGNMTGKVWVKVPQVDGNSTTDYVTLYYGCSTCTGTPYAVADSVWSAYRGVWHMNVTNENQARDVTRYRNHMSYNNNVPSATGNTTPLAPYLYNNYAKVADPAGGELDMGTGDFTMMGWVKTTMSPGVGTWPVMFGKTNPSVAPRYGIGAVMNEGGVNGGKFFIEIFSNGGQKATPFSTGIINDGNWHFIVGRRSAGTLESFLDAASQGSTASSGQDVNNPEPFVIAGTGDENAFNTWQGYPNGVSLAAAAFSNDYIKLSYMNQKPVDALISTPITLSTSSFQNTKVFKFNTTASGANVSGDVYNFPLLLRFTDATLVDATESAGQDIRFLDADGVTWLDYQIARWDQGNNVGEIWVRVPKVDGNSAGDFITMYYNQASGVTIPDGQCASCVFDVNAGFSAVWHLDNSLSDATANAISGTNTGSTDVSAIIGTGRNFDGTDDYISFGNPATLSGISTAITVEWWMKTALTSSGTTHNVIRHNGHYTALQYSASDVRSARWISAANSTNWGNFNANFADNAWHHVVVHYDGLGNTKVWRDGAVHLNASGSTSGYLATNGTSNFMLAASETGTEDWTGQLDEVRVSSVVRDSNYIKLSYQSQRAAPTLFNPATSDFVSSRKLTFNTTRTGANVKGDVANFPLLVRLTGSSLVDAVQDDWDDIRFLDGDGKTWLNYHVERWSKSLDSAEVWVLVPKVDGNSDRDFITLYYNDATDGAVANGECASCVFSTSNNFQATWHLNNNALTDATANANNGTNTGSTDGDGVAGSGRNFDGTDDYITFGNGNSLKNISAAITVEAWVKTTLTGPATVVSVIRHDGHFTSLQYGANLTTGWSAVWNPTLVYPGDFPWNGVFTDNAWHHLTVQYQSGDYKAWMDGVLVSSQTATTGSLATNGTQPFVIGANETGGEDWTGKMDEVRVSDAFRDSNYIKLSYQTQRRSGNLFWNSRPGPNNKATLTASATTTGISLAWTTPVTDSANADSVGIWVRYSSAPDSVGASGQTKVVVLPATDSAYSYPALYPATYYFALAVRNTSGQWSPFTASSNDTAVFSMNFSLSDTIYVDSAIGNDANTCTQARNPATPMRNLETADNCTATDTLVIRVMPGTYDGASNETLDPGPSQYIVYTSFDNNSRAILNGSGSASHDGAVRNWTVFMYGRAILRNMDVMCSVNGNSGVYLTELMNVVEGCRIYNNGSLKHASGIHLGNDDNLDDVLVANNIIDRPTSFGIQVQTNDKFNFINNTLIGDGQSGTKAIYVDGTSSNTNTISITNNIMVNWDYGLDTDDSDNNIGKVDNNLFHLVTLNREVTGETDDNMVVRDPLFYSTDIRNPHRFKLLPGSPAIDAGTTGLNSSPWAMAQYMYQDHFGNSRTQGTARDIGAYEGSGYTPNPTAAFDTLITAISGNTVIVKNTKWKLVWDMARGGGIAGFYDMTGDTTANLVAGSSLLFDIRIDSHLASTKTSNSIAPAFLERTRVRATVRQRLALSASVDLNVTYTVYASGHVYIQSDIANVSGGVIDLDVVQYMLKVGTATAITPTPSTLTDVYLKNGYGFLNTASMDAFLSASQDLDGNGAFTESWSLAGSTAGSTDSVGFQTSDLADPAQNMKRHHHFLLYVGDGSLDNGKASALNADALNPSPVSLSAGTLLHERSWQDGMAGHWSFDEGAGSTALDRSINYTNNAAITAGTWVSGKVGGALRFGTSSVATVTDHSALEADAAHSFMLWVKPDFSAMGADAFVMSKGLTTSDGWHFRRVSGLPRIKFVMANREVQSPDLASGTWVHLAAVTDGGIIYLYVDGVLVGASTGAASMAPNSSNLLIGKSGGGANAFAGDIDDVRISFGALPIGQIQSLVRRGFSSQYGHHHLRADNNNRVVALLNESAAQTRVQPAFLIDNWFASGYPKYVYLNGTRLIPNTDYAVDSIASGMSNSLVLQVNRILTGSSQTLFVDDNDSSGFMGEAARMKGLTMSSVANDKIVIKNFADTVFGSASSGQWYLELDLNAWNNASNSWVTDTGFGEFNVWKAAAISPNRALGSSTQLVGQHIAAGRSLAGMKYRTTTSQIYAAGLGYGGPSNITYTLTDSSATRLSLTLSTMTISGTGANITLVKRWTVYPTGRVIGSFQIITSDISMTDIQVRMMTRYNSGVTTPWAAATAISTGRWGFTGGDLDFHSLAGALLSVKSAGSTTVSPGTYMKATTGASSDNTGGADQNVIQMKLADALFESGDVPVTVNFAMDISKDFTDSATADSLMKDLQTPATITAISGTATTNDALDFNADGFAEGDGAYTFTAAGTGIAHFKYVNTVTHFNPAFRIKSWSFSSVPEYVILDNQSLISGYHYNAFVNTATSELIIQLNRTLAPGTHVLYLAHKTGLAVTLNRFEAVGGEGVDTLLWSTQSELENLGFNVYRRVAAVQDLPGNLEENEAAAGAGIANALAEAVRLRAAAAKTAADSAVDSLAGHAYSPEDLKTQGWVRLNAKLLPGAPGGSSAGERNYTYVDRTAAYGVTYEYLLEAVDFSGAKVQYGPRSAKPGNPLETALLPNYPNPFNPITTLRFALKEKSKVSLRIYDAKGRLVRTLLRPDRPMMAGKYRLQWDALDDKGFEVPSGHYFYRLAVPGYIKTRKMILLK